MKCETCKLFGAFLGSDEGYCWADENNPAQTHKDKSCDKNAYQEK